MGSRVWVGGGAIVGCGVCEMNGVGVGGGFVMMIIRDGMTVGVLTITGGTGTDVGTRAVVGERTTPGLAVGTKVTCAGAVVKIGVDVGDGVLVPVGVTDATKRVAVGRGSDVS